MKKILIFIISISAFIGCEDVNELHEKYLLEGSPVYAAKIDSLETYSGLYRIKASVLPSLDVNRNEFRVYWNNKQDSATFKYDDSYLNTENGRYEVIIDGFEDKMTEGYTTLTFINIDKQGNKSRQSESTVLIYGDDYRSGLLNQATTGFDGQFYNLVNRDGAVGLNVKYTTYQNGESTLYFDGAVEKLKIIGLNPDLPDFKSGTTVHYNTLYHINPTDIDSIYPSEFRESATITLPDPIIINESVVHRYEDSEDFNLSVKVYEGESFTSVSDQPWCTVTDDNESGNIQVSIDENAAAGSRTATITISVDGKTGADFTKEIQIVQADIGRSDAHSFDKSNWSVIDFSTEQVGSEASNLIDGDPGTSWKSDDVHPQPHYVSFDMGAEKQIYGFELTNHVWWTSKFFEIYVSDDSTTWTKVAGNTEGGNDWLDNDKFPLAPVGTTGRYVKFVIVEAYYPNFGAFKEIDVWGY